MPPVVPDPWTGIRDVLAFGRRAYQPFRPMIPEIGDALTGTGPMSEDCLRLNVWTPDTTGRRPVLVWLHGGGFRTGSGNSPFYNGQALARNHDVVVISLTHRLNAFGFLHLSALDNDRYAESANLGMQDIVQALMWVRDHIDRFGGNPGAVTVFGQSGGGGKTSILRGMPAARGLFHRSVIMATLADTAVTALEPTSAEDATEQLLQRLDLDQENLDRLHTMSPETILAAQAGPGGDIALRFTPVMDGRTLTVHPFEPDASVMAAGIPIICGSNETEGVPYGNPDGPFWQTEPTDEVSLVANVRQRLRIAEIDALELIALYRQQRPNASHADLALIMGADNSPLRLSAYTIAERKAAQGGAPVFMYSFRWRSPVRKGKLRSMHGMELPFFFDHVNDQDYLTGTDQDRFPLARNMAASLAAFARTGNPGHDGLPDWPAFDPINRATMMFDTDTTLVNDPDGTERRAMAAMRASRDNAR
jgi:para-nitrobenzyl esterase